MSKLQAAIIEEYAREGGFIPARQRRDERHPLHLITGRLFCLRGRGLFEVLRSEVLSRAKQGLVRKGYLRTAERFFPGDRFYRRGLELTEKAWAWLERTPPMDLLAPGMPQWARQVARVLREGRMRVLSDADFMLELLSITDEREGNEESGS